MSTNTYANPDQPNNIPKKLTKKASTYVDLELAKMEAGRKVHITLSFIYSSLS